jgi:hypothetical protein
LKNKTWTLEGELVGSLGWRDSGEGGPKETEGTKGATRTNRGKRRTIMLTNVANQRTSDH